MRQPPLSDDKTDDENEFYRLFKDIKPIKPHDRVQHNTPKPSPIPKQPIINEQQIFDDGLSDEWEPIDGIDHDESLNFRRNGIRSNAFKKLQKGKWPIQDQLDLHGLRSDEARLAVSQFMHDCTSKALRCVRIIHGKGLGSVGGQPILKIKVRQWLMQKQEVLAFCQAPPSHGGAGAVLVLLKT